MVKILSITLFLLLTLNARENPFFPTEGEVDIPFTSNIDTKLSPLKRATVSLPTTARAVEKVTITYKNLDGSIGNESIDLQNSVDWHLPIFISQSYTMPSAKKAPKYNKTKPEFKKIASIKYADFFSQGKTLKISTKDKILRNFLLINPHRIVIDFERDASIKSYAKSNTGIFSKVRIGNHAGYYRAVVELDGKYRYSMKKTSDGYLFKLR